MAKRNLDRPLKARIVPMPDSKLTVEWFRNLIGQAREWKAQRKVRKG